MVDLALLLYTSSLVFFFYATYIFFRSNVRQLVLFKVVLVLTLVSVVIKFLGIILHSVFLEKLFLAMVLVGVALLLAQLNRLTIASTLLNIFVFTIVWLGILEVTLLPEGDVNPIYTTSIVRNSTLVILTLIEYALIRKLTDKIEHSKKLVGEIAKGEKATLVLLSAIIMIQVVLHFIFLLSHFNPSLRGLGINLNYLGTFLGSLLMALLAYNLRSSNFFVTMHLRGLAIFVDNKLFGQLGSVDVGLVYAFRSIEHTMIKAISKNALVFSRAIRILGENTRVHLVGIFDTYERDLEDFANIFMRSIADRFERDVLLIKRLKRPEEFHKLIERDFGKKLLIEELNYAVAKYLKLI